MENNYIIANSTDRGRVRNVNEDSMVAFESSNGMVMVVCDGMGGQNAGDVASQLAVTVIQDILTDNVFPTPEEAISRSIIAANQAILHRAVQDVRLSGMGSTCVMLIIKNGQVYYGSVGDSRIYYVANRTIHQITKDQSYVQTLVDAGQITQEAAEHHQDKNQITNALGLEGMTPPVICQLPITPEPDSVFVLCSDGLSGMINNNAILNTVTRNDLPLKERADLLVRQANDAGGLDNITVQLVEFPADMNKARTGSPNLTYAKSQKKKSNALIYSVIAVLVVAAAAGAAFWFMGGSEDEPEPKPTIVIQPKQQAQPKSQPEQQAAPPAPQTTTITIKTEEKEPANDKKQVKSIKKNVEKKTVNGANKTDAIKNVIKGKGKEQKEAQKEKMKIEIIEVNNKESVKEGNPSKD